MVATSVDTDRLAELIRSRLAPPRVGGDQKNRRAFKRAQLVSWGTRVNCEDLATFLVSQIDMTVANQRLTDEQLESVTLELYDRDPALVMIVYTVSAITH